VPKALLKTRLKGIEQTDVAKTLVPKALLKARFQEMF